MTRALLWKVESNLVLNWAMWEQEQNGHQPHKCFSVWASDWPSDPQLEKLEWSVSDMAGTSRIMRLLLWANASKPHVTGWGRKDDEGAGWGPAPSCLQEMKLGRSPLTSLGPEHFDLSICLTYCDVYRTLTYIFGLWLPITKKCSLKTLGLKQSYNEIMQLSAITVLPSVLWAFFTILLWCGNAELF